MSTIKIASTVASDVAETTLKLAPARLLAFLQGVADPAIRAQFAPLGWSEERLEEAWALLNELKAASTIAKPESDPVADAIGYCEMWQSTGLVRIRAMLDLAHPDQAAFLFHDFEAGKGMNAVLNGATFLQRRHELEKGTDRKATHRADLEALKLIENTGTTKSDIKRLHDAVGVVQSSADGELARSATEQATTRLDVLRRIHAWVTAWSDMARTVVTRRDQMIKLGIAKRRAPKAKAVVTPPDPTPVVVTPPDATPPIVTPPIATTPVATPPVLVPPIAAPPVATPPVVTPPVATTPTAPNAPADEANGPQSRAA